MNDDQQLNVDISVVMPLRFTSNSLLFVSSVVLKQFLSEKSLTDNYLLQYHSLTSNKSPKIFRSLNLSSILD